MSRENVNELQQSQMKEMERALAQLQDELRKKEADYEEKLLLIRQQQASKVRCVFSGREGGVLACGGSLTVAFGASGHTWTAT